MDGVRVGPKALRPAPQGGGRGVADCGQEGGRRGEGATGGGGGVRGGARWIENFSRCDLVKISATRRRIGGGGGGGGGGKIIRNSTFAATKFSGRYSSQLHSHFL